MAGTGEARDDLLLRDMRGTSLYREVEALYRAMKRPGTGRIVDASELNVSPDGRCVAFAGSMMQQLEGEAATRICLTELATGATRVMTGGPGSDRSPRFSPDGASIAFLSDRSGSGDFQLYLLDPLNGATRVAPRVDGWAEYLEWSPNGRYILLGAARRGAPARLNRPGPR